MKKSQSPSHGFPNLSGLCLTSKNNDAPTSSSKNKRQISIEEPKENMSTSKLLKPLDSRYKNSLTYIKYIPPADDLKDFKTPEPIRKVSKILPAKGISLNKQTRTRQSKTKKSSKNKNIFKMTKDNFGQSDVNPEHLQMALALSKSTYDLENRVKSKDTEKDLPTFLSPEKIPKVKTTLEEFGFKSNKPKLHPKARRNIAEVSKRQKNSKFRFVTPLLQIRTPEEREAIITSKISLILNKNSNPSTKETHNAHYENELFSDLLKKYNKGNIIFRANRLKLEETIAFDYYSKVLNITPTNYKCGHLLRNWDEILGRDKSPVREKVHQSVEYPDKDCNNMLRNCKTIYSRKTDIVKDVNVDFREHSTTNEDKSPKISISLNEFCDKKTELVNNSPLHDIEDRNCISPDLFASEDETDSAPKTPETENVFSQSLLNLSPSKSQGLLRHNSRTEDLDSHEEKLELSKKNLFRDDRDIEHFESYCDDFKSFSQEIYNLVQSSDTDEDTEELYLKSLENNEKPVEIDLTQSSSDEGSSKEFEILGSCKSKKQTEDLSEKSTQEKYTAHADLKETESNFDMSPLLIKESNEFLLDSSFRTDTKLSPSAGESDFGCAQISNLATKSTSEMNDLSPILSRRFSRAGELNSTTVLNVTAYINQILSQDHEGAIENEDEDIGDKKYGNMSEKFSNSLGYDIKVGNNCNLGDCDNSEKPPDDELSLSQGSCSQESIVISDEELNYSSVNSRGTKSEKHVNSLNQDSSPQENIAVSDEELSNSGVSSRYKKSKKHFYNLSDTEEIGCKNIDNDMDIEEVNNVHTALKAKYGSQDISEPVHNRITELKRSSLTRKSPAKSVLEDSFNDLLEDTGILETIESEAKTIETQKNKELTCESIDKENCENKCDNIITPEKYNLQMPPTVNSDNTPENNLIIKTNNITPMANYDEMDTPKVIKELHQFGLKPLKRQRGVKLLKYLYECTHPFVGPRQIEELSSDDETHREVKKKKKNNGTANDTSKQTLVKQGNCTWDQEAVVIVGDFLLENENSEDLIFERKYSVKIPSCRVPLQIVWHNFISKNPEIKENILLYEPLQLEVLHSMLKEQSGCKFHIQDLLTFFDKKCITIRTAQGGARTRK